MLASSVVYSEFKRQSDKTDYKITFAASSLHTQLYRVRADAPLLNIRIMCLSCAACPCMDRSKLCGLSIHGLLFRVRAVPPLLNIRIMCLVVRLVIHGVLFPVRAVAPLLNIRIMCLVVRLVHPWTVVSSKSSGSFA